MNTDGGTNGYAMVAGDCLGAGLPAAAGDRAKLAVRDVRESGHTVREAAARNGVSTASVYRCMKSEGVAVPSKARRDAGMAIALRLMDEGASCKAAGAAVGFSASSVNFWDRHSGKNVEAPRGAWPIPRPNADEDEKNAVGPIRSAIEHLERRIASMNAAVAALRVAELADRLR